MDTGDPIRMTRDASEKVCQRLTTKTCPTPYVLFHPFFNVSTQISPDLEMLGWKILVDIVPIVKTAREHSI